MVVIIAFTTYFYINLHIHIVLLNCYCSYAISCETKRFHGIRKVFCTIHVLKLFSMVKSDFQDKDIFQFQIVLLHAVSFKRQGFHGNLVLHNFLHLKIPPSGQLMEFSSVQMTVSSIWKRYHIYKYLDLYLLVRHSSQASTTIIISIQLWQWSKLKCYVHLNRVMQIVYSI